MAISKCTKKHSKSCNSLLSKKNKKTKHSMKGGDVSGNTSTEEGYKKIKHIEAVIPNLNKNFVKLFGDVIHKSKERIEKELKHAKDLDIINLIAQGVIVAYRVQKPMATDQEIMTYADSVIDSIDHRRINQYVEKAVLSYMKQKIGQIYSSKIRSTRSYRYDSRYNI